MNELRLPPHSGKQHLSITRSEQNLNFVSMGPIRSRGLLGPIQGRRHETSMPCTRPLVRTVINRQERVVSLKAYLSKIGERLEFDADQKQQKWNEQRVKKLLKEQNAQLLPCGHCPGCKMANAASWANRMEMELPYHENAWFLTLTYDNENVPYRATWDTLTGEMITENLSLCYEDNAKILETTEKAHRVPRKKKRQTDVFPSR